MGNFRDEEMFLVGPGGGKMGLRSPSGGSFGCLREDFLGLRGQLFMFLVWHSRILRSDYHLFVKKHFINLHESSPGSTTLHQSLPIVYQLLYQARSILYQPLSTSTNLYRPLAVSIHFLSLPISIDFRPCLSTSINPDV